jgi:uncharacterized membrane protein YdjX (TVP38/TMEM64 family)
VLLAALALSVAGLLLFGPLREHAPELVERLRSAGFAGALVFGLAYVVAVVAMFPASLFTMAGGYVYGPIWGVAVVWPVSTLAGTAAFLMGRTVARPWARRKIAGSRRLAAIDHAIGEGGFKIVFLLRLSPIAPFNLLNYLLGASRLRLRDFVLSAVGSLPATFLYVYLGSLVPSAAALLRGERPSGGTSADALYVIGLLATVLVTVILGRAARRSLDRVIPDEPAVAPDA